MRSGPLSRQLVPLAFAVLSTACFANFDDFHIVGDGDGDTDSDVDTDSDTDADTDTDADGDWTDNPMDRGTPCNDPHLLVGLSAAGSSIPARLLRFNLSPDGPPTYCRETPVMTDQIAFGSDLQEVTALANGTEIVATAYAVLGLDTEGFPRWRWQRWEPSSFHDLKVFPIDIGGGSYIGVLHCDDYCSSGLVCPAILDSGGNEVGYIDTSPLFTWDLAAGAPHPTDLSRIVLANEFETPLVFTIDTDTTVLDDTDGVELAPHFDIDDVGYLQRLETDTVTRRIIAVYLHGIEIWRVGESVPTSVMTCNECEEYHAAAFDPHGEQSAYVVCTRVGESRPSLVRLSEFGCDQIVDGSAHANHEIVDVVLVHGAL
jgi:hypothetical protein